MGTTSLLTWVCAVLTSLSQLHPPTATSWKHIDPNDCNVSLPCRSSRTWLTEDPALSQSGFRHQTGNPQTTKNWAFRIPMKETKALSFQEYREPWTNVQAARHCAYLKTKDWGQMFLHWWWQSGFPGRKGPWVAVTSHSFLPLLGAAWMGFLSWIRNHHCVYSTLQNQETQRKPSASLLHHGHVAIFLLLCQPWWQSPLGVLTGWSVNCHFPNYQ